MCRLIFLFLGLCVSFQVYAQTYGVSTATSYFAPNSEVISRVSFGTLPFDVNDLNNPSLGGTLVVPCTGYSDFTVGNNTNLDGNLTNEEYAFGVAKTQTYHLEVEGGFCSSNFSNVGLPNRAIKVFVDFNDDGDFTDPLEQVYVSSDDVGFSQVDEPIFNTDITIPVDAVVGELTMRIVYRRVGSSFFDLVFWDLPNSGSTGSYARGETEDYTLIVTGYIEDVIAIDESCNGADDGQITITPNAAAPAGVEFSINGSVGPWVTDLNFSNLPSGQYDVWARDAALSPNYVYEQYQVEVGSPSNVTVSALITSDYNGADVSCAQNADGEITLSPFGGDASSYSFEYTDQLTNTTIASANNVISGLLADTYDVVAIDGSGCQSQPISITLQAPDPNGPFGVSLTGQITSDYNGQDVSCAAASDGQLTVTPSGGDGSSYSYQITDLSTNTTLFSASNVFDNLMADTYEVIVTDGSGCESSVYSFTLTGPNPISIDNIQLDTDYNGYGVSCFGGCDGQITVTAGGGTAPYNYSVNGFDNGSNGTVSSICSGLSTITVTDNNNCILNTDFPISEPSLLQISSVTTTSDYNGQEVSCFNSSDATISVAATGGVGSYTYSIDGGTLFPYPNTINNLQAGNYSVAVQDLNGCQSSNVNHLVTQPADLTISPIITLNSPSCNGNNDGSISFSASGGTTAYQYSIDNGSSFQASSLFSNLISGNYSLMVEDANGCLETTDVFLNQPLPVSFTGSISSDYNGQDISCSGASDGQITINASGGDGIYTYEYTNQLSGVTQTSASNIIDNLGKGTYDIVVYDSQGCSSPIVSFTLVEPPTLVISDVLLASDYSGFDVSCFAECDAQLSISAIGGVAPYNYNVNGVDNGSVSLVNSVCPGNASITITDLNSCVAISNLNVSEPPLLEITSVTTTSDYNGQEISCNGQADASISITANGGAGNNGFSIDGGVLFPHSSSINGLNANTYQLVVEDNNGCQSAIFNYIISEPVPVTVNAVSNTVPISCNGYGDGSISLQTFGGTQPYQFSINGVDYQPSSTFDNLTAGNYTILIQDLNGCEGSTSYLLGEPSPVEFVSNVISNYNGFDVSCNGYSDGAISLVGLGGGGTYFYQINSSGGLSPIPFNNEVTNLASGSYTITVSDQNNCLSAPQIISLNEPNILEIVSIQETSPVSCFGFSDGIINVVAQGGVGSYTYNAGIQYPSGNQNPYNITNLSAGPYNINVVDENGCISSFVNQEVTQPAPLQTNISTTNLGCNDDDSGDASVAILGGISPYEILWSTNQTDPFIDNLSAGQYSVSITDANNCSIESDFEITVPILESTTTDLVCFGDNNGEILVSLTNANPLSIFTYLWDDANAQTTLSASNLSAGAYTLTATDQFNCVLQLTDTIFNPDSLSVFVDHTAICQDNPIAQATVYTSGGTTPYNYQWSTGEFSEQINILTANSYSVTVTDVNNCQAQVDFNVEPLNPISVSFTTTNPSCKDNIDGQIITDVNGGYPPYRFNWSNFSSDQNLTRVSQGTYFLDVIDNQGCVVSTSAVLQSNTDNCLYVYSAFSPNGDQNNDYWHIDNIELYPDAIVEVFNRWGDRVFSTKRYINAWDGAWDGSYNNNPLPAATYYYVITLNNEEEPYVGYVAIVR